MILNRCQRCCLFSAIFILLTGCDSTQYYAPVSDITSIASMDLVPVTRKAPEAAHFSESSWKWPVASKNVIQFFSPSSKGINIAGSLGDPIFAVAAGEIVYAGNGLRGYGNLIIIKHNNRLLSAYAHQRIILVKEGAWVKRGQKIAEMGNAGSDKVMLHFEVRREGKPIDPLVLLQRK